MIGGMVRQWSGDILGTCGAVTVVFQGTTLVGIVGAVHGVADVTVHGASGVVLGAAWSSEVGKTCFGL